MASDAGRNCASSKGTQRGGTRNDWFWLLTTESFLAKVTARFKHFAFANNESLPHEHVGFCNLQAAALPRTPVTGKIRRAAPVA